MLLITHGWEKDHFGGRQQYSRCLAESLSRNNYEGFKVYNVNPYTKLNFLDKLFSLKVDNILSTDIKNIIKIIKDNNIKLIIIDCSSFGLLCKKIKSFSKNIKIIVIYHHIECNFFLQLFYSSKNIKNILIALKMYINECLSSKYSDKQIFFTKRDFDYGKSLFKSKNSEIFPVAQPLIRNSIKNDNEVNLAKPYVLFVGGGGLIPNYHGILWFINKVVPKIKFPLVVVGSGYENLIKKNFKDVIFTGKINDLSKIYKNANLVVAPIFSGSGMKTKIAEAASYGKTVFGTSEAINGYEKFLNKICIVCDDEDNFIKKINNYGELINLEENVLKIYHKNYSIEAMNLNFTKLIKSLI
tara:strand:+ start:142 stop:1209 length:1068 start_codon:yes stop_codon:yes gene_type:complete